MNEINSNQKEDKEFFFEIKKSFIFPSLMVFLVLALNLFYKNYATAFSEYFNLTHVDFAENFIYLLSLGLISYWLFSRLISNVKGYLLAKTFLSIHQPTRILLPFFASLCRIIFGLGVINFIVPYLGLPEEFSYLSKKVTSILIISAISWSLFKLVSIAEQLLLNHYQTKAPGDLQTRKVYTQTLILKRISSGIILVLTIGAILMLFDNVKALGASVLTTAGVLGLVLTFTAQRSLGSIFSGLEIALTQPIKIGDAIVIENEFGTVEEINFRNVIIKLWDWRRLVVPTSYFLEKSFQNWSREQSNNLIGTVYLYADFTLSVDALRDELKTILEHSQLWDKKVVNVQVSDLKERVMELRVLASAKTPGEAWDLRCEVREKLMAYIAKHQPHALPMSRTHSLTTKGQD